MSAVGRRTEFISVGSLRLRVSRSGTGPPFLLINGIGGNLEMWQPLDGQLSERELITFDFPGCGLSPPARRP